jgi:hypothetical protein
MQAIRLKAASGNFTVVIELVPTDVCEMQFFFICFFLKLHSLIFISVCLVFYFHNNNREISTEFMLPFFCISF